MSIKTWIITLAIILALGIGAYLLFGSSPTISGQEIPLPPALPK